MQDISTDLVSTAADGTPTTTSVVIADGTGVQHQNVRELIEDNRADFEEFGVLRFETGVNRQRWVVLNEEQATLLLTYMRNSEPVKQFKKRLVRAFFALRDLADRQQHQLNAAIFQARAQMELCQAAQGLIHPDHLEARARVILARGMGERAELDQSSRPLYTSDFLKGKKLTAKRTKSVAGVFGKRCKAAYIERYGAEPKKYPLDLANGQTRDVLAYTEADRGLLESVWQQFYAGPTQLEVQA